jgi:hypothetical protein
MNVDLGISYDWNHMTTLLKSANKLQLAEAERTLLSAEMVGVLA